MISTRTHVSSGARDALLAANSVGAAQTFQNSMSGIFAEYLAAANLLGRLHVLQEVKKRTGQELRISATADESQFAETVVLGFESVPFDQASKRIANLTGYTKVAFEGLAKKYRMSAFTIAGISDVKLIDAIQAEMLKALQGGGTAEDFKKAVDGLTSKAGVEAIAKAHIDTVFQTNVQRAYSHGRLEQLVDPAVKAAVPYWQYMTAGDGRVRPAHAALDGFTAKNDDPVWRRIYPPLGFNCRCGVIGILADEAPDDADLPGLGRIPFAASSVPDPGFGGAFAEVIAA